MGQARCDAAQFLDGPTDEGRRLRVGFGRVCKEGGWFARWRMLAIMANASMTRLTCRCQPCHERVSLWSSPSSFLAVSKLSSMAQRRPSTAASVAAPVPAGHQVVK